MIGAHEQAPATGADPRASAASDPIALFARWEAQSREASTAADEENRPHVNPKDATPTAATSAADGADPLCASLLPAITTTLETVFPDGEIVVQDASVAEDAVVVQVTFHSGAAGDDRAAALPDSRPTGVRHPVPSDRPHRWVEGTSDVVAAG